MPISNYLGRLFGGGGGPGGSIPLNNRTLPPSLEEGDRDPRSMMPPPGGAYTGDPESDYETVQPPSSPDDQEMSGMANIGEKKGGFQTNATVGDLLPMGLTAIISSLVKDQGAKDALREAGEGFGEARLKHIMGERKNQQEQENMLIEDAHKAWNEIHGMDIANMPPAVKQKIMQLNQTYNKALQDGKITPKEALEISAYAGMVKRAVGEAKPQMAQEQAMGTARNKVQGDIAGRQAEEEFIQKQDPASTGQIMGVPNPADTDASVARGMLEERRQKSPEYQRQTRIEVEKEKNAGRIRAAEIRADAQVRRGAAGGKKGNDSAFRQYQQLKRSLRSELDKGNIEAEEYAARLEELAAEFGNQYGQGAWTRGRGAEGSSDDPLGLGLGAARDTITPPPGRPQNFVER